MTPRSILRLLSNLKEFTFRRPRGFDLFKDLKSVIPEPTVVFDIGANIGQSAEKYLKEFPQARIHSFEPVEATFRKLVANIGDKAAGRFVPERLALGSAPATARMDTSHGSPDMFQLADNGNEVVEVTTVDLYCAELPSIDFMKIDAEGHDLEVLKGAERMLREKRIGAIQVEAGMNPLNDRHVPFETFKHYLEAREYYLFGIYDQVHEFFSGEPQLRRTNPVFIPKR